MKRAKLRAKNGRGCSEIMEDDEPSSSIVCLSLAPGLRLLNPIIRADLLKDFDGKTVAIAFQALPVYNRFAKGKTTSKTISNSF